MIRPFLMSAVAAFPFAAHAADLSGDTRFVDETFTPTIERGVVGHLELALGWSEISIDQSPNRFLNEFWNEQGGVFEGWGRANIPIGGYVNLEIETGGIAFFDDGASRTGYGVFGHLWGGWNGVRLGVFGGAGFHDITIGTVGIEGEVDLGNLTLGAQGSYNFTDDGLVCPPGLCDEDYWGVRAWADFYVTPNTKIGGEVGWWQLDDFTGGDGLLGINQFSASGRIEHRFASTPISAFARVDYWDFGRFDLQTVIVSGGLRIFLDRPDMTLQDHDREVPFDFRNGAGEAMTVLDLPALFRFLEDS